MAFQRNKGKSGRFSVQVCGKGKDERMHAWQLEYSLFRLTTRLKLTDFQSLATGYQTRLSLVVLEKTCYISTLLPVVWQWLELGEGNTNLKMGPLNESCKARTSGKHYTNGL